MSTRMLIFRNICYEVSRSYAVYKPNGVNFYFANKQSLSCNISSLLCWGMPISCIKLLELSFMLGFMSTSTILFIGIEGASMFRNPHKYWMLCYLLWGTRNYRPILDVMCTFSRGTMTELLAWDNLISSATRFAYFQPE